MGEKFQIVSYDITVKVSPLHRKEERDIAVTHGTKKRRILTDNKATVFRTVLFSKRSQPRIPYTLRYSTRGDGFVYPATLAVVKGKKGKAVAVENCAGKDHLCRYDDHGKEVVQAFFPKASHAYSMNVPIVGGFDVGARDAHFHIPRPGRYESINVRLDLAAYANSGFLIAPTPALYYHPQDSGDHEFCARRGVGTFVVPVAADAPGAWHWQLGPMEEGVLDLVWDLTPPESWIPLAVENEGIERLGSRTLRIIPILLDFYDLGLKAREMQARGKSYSIRALPESLYTSRQKVENLINVIYEFFRDYFKEFGNPPHERAPFDTAPSHADVAESAKIFHRVKNSPFRICNPRGWGAWKLTEQYLLSRELIDVKKL